MIAHANWRAHKVLLAHLLRSIFAASRQVRCIARRHSDSWKPRASQDAMQDSPNPSGIGGSFDFIVERRKWQQLESAHVRAPPRRAVGAERKPSGAPRLAREPGRVREKPPRRRQHGNPAGNAGSTSIDSAKKPAISSAFLFGGADIRHREYRALASSTIRETSAGYSNPPFCAARANSLFCSR